MVKPIRPDLRVLTKATVTADIIDLAVVRRRRSTDDWCLAFFVVDFCVFTGMLALKFSPMLGANALIEWIK